MCLSPSMDPVTRREADRIEAVLADLEEDLELVSYLPEAFNLWMRDDLVPTLEKCQEELLQPGSDASNVEDDEERQQLIKAMCFLQVASQYGDPSDPVGNESLVQVNEFNEAERDLLETATTVGYLDSADLEFHHLALRSLLDTLREGGYAAQMREFIKAYYPTSGTDEDEDAEDGKGDANSNGSRSSSSSSEEGTEGKGNLEEKKPDFDRAEACESGMMSESVDNFRRVVHTLRRLMELRNNSTVNDDIHRYKVLHEAVNKEQSATADVQALNKEYEEMKEARKRDVAALDEEIAALAEEIAYVQRAADVELEAFREVSERIQEEHMASYKRQLEQHQQQAEALDAKLQQLQEAHTEETNTLRVARAKKEAAVSGAIGEYDAHVRDMTLTTRKLQKETQKDTEKIVALEDELGKLGKDKREYEWEMRVREQRQEHANDIRQRQEQHARLLQAYIRAYLARLTADKEMNKKKKKGKKSKK